MGKLKPVRRFRKIRVKACGNCKYLQRLNYGMLLKCARPSRKRTPQWEHTAWVKPHTIFEALWTHVCDRWRKQDETGKVRI